MSAMSNAAIPATRRTLIRRALKKIPSPLQLITDLKIGILERLREVE
jgi:hypothetical protein